MVGTLSTSIVVQSKKARLGATVHDLANEVFVDLNQTLGNGMRNASRAEFAFGDGGTGVMLAFDLLVTSGNLRHYSVLRVQGDRL